MSDDVEMVQARVSIRVDDLDPTAYALEDIKSQLEGAPVMWGGGDKLVGRVLKVLDAEEDEIIVEVSLDLELGIAGVVRARNESGEIIQFDVSSVSLGMR